MIRFVRAPEGDLVPDLAGKLPGRGVWIMADRLRLEARGAIQSLEAKAARQIGSDIRLDEDAAALADRLDQAMVQALLSRLGLMRASGRLMSGFEKVSKALRAGEACVIIEAEDAGDDGRKKLKGQAFSGGREIPVVDLLPREALSEALGLGNAVHLAITDSNMARGFLDEALRLSAFRGKAMLTVGGAD